MSKKVAVDNKGIKNKLKSFKPFHAIAEYVWNGFDANASEVCINYTTSELGLGSIKELSITDNGKGIPHEDLELKFKPVFSSEKHNTYQSLTHGKNGLGRLTFYHFCQSATWNTVFSKDNQLWQYSIDISDGELDRYKDSSLVPSNITSTGTTVTFKGINLSEDELQKTVTNFLIKEFSWFLELKTDFNFIIKINENVLNYATLIKDVVKTDIEIGDYVFNVKFVRWSDKLNREWSRFYGLDLEGNCKYSNPTTFNNKGDAFYHSVFISSEFFNQFKYESADGQSDCITPNSDKSPIFKTLLGKLNNFLRIKRKPVLVDYSESLVEEYEKTRIFPEYNTNNKWEKFRADDLRETVKQLYQVEPRIFSELNIPQKKTFVGLLSLLLDHGETEDLFKILDSIVKLSSDEREIFANQLKVTRLSSIIKTIELISDRFKSVEELKKLVFDRTMYASEVPHLQKMMERNYWLIGEEYQLITAAEPDFEEALRRFHYVLNNDAAKKQIEHPDKNREMDIFLIRQDKIRNKIENVVLELKHPVNVNLGKKELDQIYDYYQVIRSESRFNATNMEWKFYLIGNKFNESGYIESQIESHKAHGEAGLVFRGEYKIYVFRWSELFAEFELRHNFLNQKLELERDRLMVNEHLSADDIVNSVRTSDSPTEIQVSKF